MSQKKEPRNPMTPDEMIAALEASGDYRVLRRPPKRVTRLLDLMAGERLGVVLDVETTGLDPETDEIIELAMVPFVYDETGRVCGIGEPFSALRQPTLPIPPEITEITGIDDAMVAGQVIDLETVATIVAPARLVVSHNAEFDRGFAEHLSEVFVHKAWACSMQEIPWQTEGFLSQRLASLVADLGFFYERHRAVSDCLALIEVLDHPLPKSGIPALAALLASARQPTWDIWAVDAPLKTKDTLKARGYRWNPGEDGRPKAWYRAVSDTARDPEIAFLRETVYHDRLHRFPVQRVSAYDRFAKRQVDMRAWHMEEPSSGH